MTLLPDWLSWPRSALIETPRVNDVVTLFVQRSDNRGVKLRKKIILKKPPSAVVRVWRALQQETRPDVCIDVGANYGEVSLSSRYDAGQKVYLVEANPHLVQALSRSVATHATPEQIDIVPCFAGEADGEAAFHVDLKWSGASSALFKSEDSAFKGRGKQAHETIGVHVRAVDDIVRAGGGHARPSILMKVDVEGAELQALRGAQRTLAEGPFSCLIVECNIPVIVQMGAKVPAWLAEVGSLGEVFVIEKQGLRKCEIAELGDRKCDLAVIRDGTPDGAVLSRVETMTY